MAWAVGVFTIMGVIVAGVVAYFKIRHFLWEEKGNSKMPQEDQEEQIFNEGLKILDNIQIDDEKENPQENEQMTGDSGSPTIKRKYVSWIVFGMSFLVVIAFIGGIILERNTETSQYDVYQFGGYSWYVLQSTEDKILLLSCGVVDYKEYGETTNTWEYCNARYYLNGAFFDTFSPADKKRIIESNLKTVFDGGVVQTTDYVFLLSTSEEIKYNIGRFKISSDWWLRDGNNDKISFVDINGYLSWEYSNNLKGIRPAIWINK